MARRLNAVRWFIYSLLIFFCMQISTAVSMILHCENAEQATKLQIPPAIVNEMAEHAGLDGIDEEDDRNVDDVLNELWRIMREG